MIYFFYEKVDFNIKNINTYIYWLKLIIKKENFFLKNLCYIFCNDEFLLNINYRFLKHKKYTDVISFDYSKKRNLSGDIFISLDRILFNYKIFNNRFDDELKFVMIHGLLHIMGYNDKLDEDKIIMINKQNLYLSYFYTQQNK